VLFELRSVVVEAVVVVDAIRVRDEFDGLAVKVGGAGVIAHGGVDERGAVGEFVEQSTTGGECVVEAALV